MWVGWAALHREAVRIDDVARDGRAIAISGTPLGAKSVIVIPLLVEEMLVGVARAVKMGVRLYTDDHLRFAQTLTSQAALAIAAAENARGDRMKTVNDQFGHAEGDRLLVEISGDDARRYALDRWLAFCNRERPHTALGGLSPERWLRARVTSV